LLLDQETLDALARYAGSVIAVELLNTRQTVYVRITTAGIELTESINGRADVSIRGTPTQLLAYLAAMRRDEPGRSGTIEITGNIALAQKIIGIIKGLDPDWEEKLSEWVGDSIAHGTGNAIRSTLKVARYAGDTLRDNASEYLRYESGLVPDRVEINDFNSAVDVLRNDVERLKSRISRLQQSVDKA
jgi:ubiquinone biosynthesis accessory factor UbiJ